MSNFEKNLSAAELAREKMKAFRRSLAAESLAPEVFGLLPSIPGDEVKRLQLARQGLDCIVEFARVEIPEGARPKDCDIALTRDRVPVSSWIELPVPVPTDFTMTLPALHTATPGPFKLGFAIVYGSITTYSPTSSFYIDTTAPNHGNPGAEALPPAEIIGGVVTKEYLDAEGGVKMTIASPEDVKNGDIVRGYYGKSNPAVEIGSFPVTDDFTVPITIPIPKASIENGAQGANIFYFRYEDRTGNIGPVSAETNLTIQLTPVPSGLQPPVVPAALDGLVDRADAIPSVGVTIPAFSNGLAGDKARVFWNGKAQPLKDTDGTVAVIVDVSFVDVAAGGDVQTGVPVSYEIDRAGDIHREPLGTLVDVNVSIAGPVDPDPDPENGNPNLVAVTVKGAVTAEDNTLLEGDKGQPATVTVPIYDERKLGDLVRLYWNGVAVPGDDGLYTVRGDEASGDLMDFKIASSIFEATKNGIFKVHYVITNLANGANENPSQRQDVDVYIFPVILKNPRLMHLHTTDSGRILLGCSSLRDIPVVGKAAIVRVEGGEPLKAGLVLNFTWKGNTFNSAPTLPTPVEDFLIIKTLEGNEHVDGFEVYLPFNTALKPIKDGDGEITYTTTIDGRDHPSGAHLERVIMIDIDQNYCPGT
ncbi:hypothetical protein [Pseudomonas sp. RT6P73]